MSQVLTSSVGDVSCPTVTTCLAVGGNVPGGGFIDTSTDAGATWQSLTPPSGVLGFSGVSCPSSTDCAAVGSTQIGGFDFPLILTSSDGGQTWQAPAVPSTVSTQAVSCATNATMASCEVVGGDSQGGGAILGGVVPPPPTTAMLIPSNGATVSGGSQVLDATGSSTIGIKSVTFEVSGGALSNHVVATATPTIYGWVAHWNTTTLPNGTYSLQSVATDVEGASAASAPFTITVNNPPPTTSVIIPSNNAMTASTQLLDAAASSGVSQVQYEVSGGPSNLSDQVVATATPTFYGWLANWNTTSVPNGTYTLQSVASYSGGVSGSSSPITIAVNNPPPTTSVIIPSNNATTAGTQLLDAAASSGVSQVQYEVSGGPSNLSDQVVATATPTLYGWLANWNTTSVPNGTYALQSVASYAGGLTGTSSPDTITVAN
jgi:predicted Zn-dependent protease